MHHGKAVAAGGVTPPSRKNELLLRGVNPPIPKKRVAAGGGVTPLIPKKRIAAEGGYPPQPRKAYCSSVPYWDHLNKI